MSIYLCSVQEYWSTSSRIADFLPLLLKNEWVGCASCIGQQDKADFKRLSLQPRRPQLNEAAARGCEGQVERQKEETFSPIRLSGFRFWCLEPVAAASKWPVCCPSLFAETEWMVEITYIHFTCTVDRSTYILTCSKRRPQVNLPVGPKKV